MECKLSTLGFSTQQKDVSPSGLASSFHGAVQGACKETIFSPKKRQDIREA